jgi:YNFM family putative membrane transporter
MKAPEVSEGALRGARYQRISAAMFLVGFATFSLIYCVQPVLPQLAQDFHVSPAQSSLVLSLTTAALAVALLLGPMASEWLGRGGLMFASLCGASILNVVDAFMPHWRGLLLARTLQGLMLGGVPAVAIAYLAEEIHFSALGLSMGLYIGGTAFGGMIGRVGMGFLAQLSNWRTAAWIIGLVDFAATFGFFLLLPPSRQGRRRVAFQPRYHLQAWLRHLRDPALFALFLIGFLLMGSFVASYNYLTFRLIAPPWSLTTTQVSLIFIVYLFGTASSALAGAWADRIGKGPVLLLGLCIAIGGLLVTLSRTLAVILAGVAIVTIGFFMTHSIASAWVGHRARETKGHAASLYLLFYYIGASAVGWAGGFFWLWQGWAALVAFTAALLLVAVAAAASPALKGEHRK